MKVSEVGGCLRFVLFGWRVLCWFLDLFWLVWRGLFELELSELLGLSWLVVVGEGLGPPCWFGWVCLCFFGGAWVGGVGVGERFLWFFWTRA